MKRATTVFLSGAVLVSTVALGEIDPVRGKRPLPPHALITKLPDPPESWKTIRSTAETRFGDWLETYTVRVFEKTSEPPDQGPPRRTTISILDTAAFPGSTAMFDDFQPGEDENYKKQVIKNHPAFLIPLGEDEHETILLVGGRFLVTIFVENQPERMQKKWLEIMDLSELEEVPEGESINLPETIQMVEIDQLNPKRNRVYSLAISSDTEPGEDEEDAD